MALGIFIEQNDKLLSALAVFSGLVAFSKEFQPEWLGAAIAFIFIAGLVLVAWELRGRFPEKMAWPLYLFRYVILWGLGGILIYWVYTYRIFWDMALWLPMIVISWWLAWSTLREVALTFKFTRWIFGFDTEKRNRWQAFALITANIVIGGYAFLSGGWLSVGTNIAFDIAKQIWH